MGTTSRRHGKTQTRADAPASGANGTILLAPVPVRVEEIGYNGWFARTAAAPAGVEPRHSVQAVVPFSRRTRRVPADALVGIGAGDLLPAPRRPALVSPPRRELLANDNARDGEPEPEPTKRRTTGRDILFLAILFATILGAFYGGRLHAYQKIIVVPAPSSAHSRVT